jgi:HAD superfamily hydrolase (TIGR01509 family)
VTAPDGLAKLLSGSGPILLDFDGPVCSIFAGYPAREIADGLRNTLRDNGIDLPDPIEAEPDPLEILRWTDTLGSTSLTRTVEDTLCAAELRAVESAAPTPYAREVIVAAREAGKPVAVVSNNSPEAVTAYLTARRLAGHVSTVVGRAYAQPARMKPNPEPILRAVILLEANATESVLIGDSLSDITGGQAAGVPVIAYANRPDKAAPFAKAGAAAVVTSMAGIAVCLVDPSTD